ncbi:hypothetical protein MMC25_007798 [Agyrium rufum]|nr:hypothetical protein [Agyrium rufum]
MPQPVPSDEISSTDAINPGVSEISGAQTRVKQAMGEVTDAGASNGNSAAGHTKSEVEKAADKLYEERMEDEYAKREGGA